MTDFGIYIHSPFCRSKCIYCDFNSYAGREKLAESYVESLLGQIDDVANSADWPTVTSVYFGGGNPALLGPAAIGRLLSALRKNFVLAGDAEISAELNPEDAGIHLLEEWRDAGMDRISLGWQSLDDDCLKLLGRRHDAEVAIESSATAKRVGFANVNVDMIYGLPGQTQARWCRDLKTVTANAPAHISAYMLSVETGTPLEAAVAAGKIVPLEDDAVADMYIQTARVLAAGGYEQYEISNYSVAGGECRHNLNYWLGGDYLGFGAGAHSHWRGRRWWNHSEPEKFIRTVKTRVEKGSELLDAPSRVAERIMLGLRLNAGVDIDRLSREFQLDLRGRYTAVIKDLIDQGLLDAGERLMLTGRGRLLANEAMAAFVE